MRKLDENDFGVMAFTGLEMAARWWWLFGGRRFSRRAKVLPAPVDIAGAS